MCGCYFLAIVGGSASGKSELARALIESLPQGQAGLLREDDYYICSSQQPKFDPTTYNFDEPAAKEQALLAAHLLLLRGGRAIDRPVYDYVTHRRTPRSITVRPAPLVVVEGLHLLTSPVLRAAFDASVFIETPAEVRLARRIARDVAERGRTEHSVRQQFATRVSPMHALHVAPQRSLASLTVNGADPVEALVERVRLQLPECLRG